MALLAEVGLPEGLAREVVGHDPGGAEAGYDPLSVGDRRGGAVRVGLVAWVVFFVGDALLPAEFARLPVEGHERPLLAVLQGLGDEHCVAPDNGRGVPGFRQFRAPPHVLGLAPAFWKAGLGRGVVLVRAAPGGPLGRAQGSGSGGPQEYEAGEGDAEGVHGVGVFTTRPASPS